MHPIKAYFKRKFWHPPIYARIAELLREGNYMVRLKYRNRTLPRYYSGSGHLCNSGWGINARWNVHVEYFRKEGNSNEYVHVDPQYAWIDPGELELLLANNWDNVFDIEAIPYPHFRIDDVVKSLHDKAGKLRTGQGYSFGKYHITNELYGKDGYRFHHDQHVWNVPTHMLALTQYVPDEELNCFNRDRVLVADDNLIKREHRMHSDIKRWYVCKQVPTSRERHVLQFTPRTSGQTPVFYYSLVIKIDDKSKAGHPFFVKHILESAINDLREKHVGHDLVINPDNIKVEWDTESTDMKAYCRSLVTYPARVDTHPIVIYRDIKPEYYIRKGHGVSIIGAGVE